MDDLARILELGRDRYQCSQILLLLGLRLQGREAPDLIRSMHGLCGGLAVGETCGALTGGACLLGLYAGRAFADEEEDPRLLMMLDDLVTWFKETYGEQFGGIRCEQIVGPLGEFMPHRCPELVVGVYQRCKELLVENGFELTGGV